jgi:hypothetical protein
MKKPTKFGPRYGMKRFVEGGKVPGMTSYAESGSAGGSNISFKDAFREARKQGLDTFTWRGKKYTTEMKEDKKPKEAAVNFAKEGKAPSVDFAKEGRVRPNPRAIAAGAEVDEAPSQAMRDEARYKVRNQKAPGKPGGNRPKPTIVTLDDAYKAMRKNPTAQGYKRGGSVKRYASGGSVSSASKRADGCATKGKTRGRMI